MRRRTGGVAIMIGSLHWLVERLAEVTGTGCVMALSEEREWPPTGRPAVSGQAARRSPVRLACTSTSHHTTLPPHCGTGYQFQRWLSVATRNRPRPPSWSSDGMPSPVSAVDAGGRG